MIVLINILIKIVATLIIIPMMCCVAAISIIMWNHVYFEALDLTLRNIWNIET